MYSYLAGDGWEFTPVLDLIKPLSNGPSKPPERCLPPNEGLEVSSVYVHHSNSPDKKSGLGNFDKIWEFLEQPSSPPTEPLRKVNSASNITEINPVLDKEVGTSKLVKWRDKVEGADLVDNDGMKEITSASSGKRHRSGRKRSKNTALAPLGGMQSEPEVDNTNSLVDRRSIILQIIHGSQMRENPIKAVFCPRDNSGTQSDPELNCRVLKRSKLAALSSSDQNDYATAAARKARLMIKLHSMFVNERHYLNDFGVPAKLGSGAASTDSDIHVFVDASNIMIGFHDALKISRTIKTRIPLQPLSFHNLSLILERGRPASKKVLVGSDNFPAIQEAKLIGYEINILERVHKARELSPRKKRNSYNGQSSGSETTARWVEQAVDEILHLKILESVIDAKTPSTIVLATGDGAEAEYSQGFLKMVERALAREWKVELVSFKKNISHSYTKKRFRALWGTNFRIIELDDFVEELLSA